MLNQARLRVLKSRDEHIDTILEDARGRLNEITKDTVRWNTLLGQLVNQVNTTCNNLLLAWKHFAHSNCMNSYCM